MSHRPMGMGNLSFVLTPLKSLFSHLQRPPLFRCIYCISMRGYVHPLVCWSFGPSVHWSVSLLYELQNLLENHHFQMRLLHLYQIKTLSIHWSIHPLVFTTIHLSVRPSISRVGKAKKFLTRFNTNSTVKLRVKNARVKMVCFNWC